MHTDEATATAALLLDFGQAHNVWSLRDGVLRGPRGLYEEFDVESTPSAERLTRLATLIGEIGEVAEAEALDDHRAWLEGEEA